MAQIFDPFYGDLTEVVGRTMAERKRVPGELFPTVRGWSNTPTADFIPTRLGDHGLEYLLGRRLQKPWAGQFFFLGGRIFPGLTPEEGLVMVCKRELGLTFAAKDALPLLWQSIYNPEDEHGGDPYFTMSHCWQIWVPPNQEFVLEENQEEYRWFRRGHEEVELPYYTAQAVARLSEVLPE